MKKIFKIFLLTLLLLGAVFSQEILARGSHQRANPPSIKKVEPIRPERKEEVIDIKKELPQPQFLSPLENEKLREKAKITIQIPQAEEVEFYLRQPQSLAELYLGRGEREGEFWSLEIDTTNLPNGEYFLFPKIFGPFGAYGGKEVRIFIENPIRIEEKQPEIEKINENILPKREELLKKEEEIEQVLKSSQEEFQKVVQDSLEKIKEKLPPEETIKVEERIKEQMRGVQKEIREYKRTIEESVKVEKKILPPEKKGIVLKEKREIHQKIVEQVSRPLEEVKEKLPPEEHFALKEELKNKVKSFLGEFEQVIKEKVREKSEITSITLQDSDEDNLSDWDEIRLGTNPFISDSDNDGYLDGYEVIGGYDPLTPGAAQKVVYQDPRKFGKVSERLKIEKVEIIPLKEGKRGLKITGRGIPNSFVTIYIFSSPLIAMVKVNSQGKFEYILDKDLSDGYHSIYLALTNNKGEIQEKSTSYLFLKSGDQLVRISELQAGSPPSPLESLGRGFFLLVLSLIIFGLSVGFFIVGISARKKIG